MNNYCLRGTIPIMTEKMSNHRGRSRLLACIGFVLFAGLAVLFGLYDLKISQAIVNEENAFGRFLEVFGELIAPLFAGLAGLTIVVYFYRDREAACRRIKMLLGALVGLAGISYSALVYNKLGVTASLVAVLVTGLLFGLCAAWLLRQSPDRLYELVKIAGTTVCFLIAVLVIVNIFKIFWGRVRFREMTDLAQFSPWYDPQGINGHRSFPSGHTANAATLWALTLFVPICRKTWQKVLCYAVPAAVIVTMAVSRVLVGAHYSSDVLFGAAITIALFYLTRAIVNKFADRAIKG